MLAAKAAFLVALALVFVFGVTPFGSVDPTPHLHAFIARTAATGTAGSGATSGASGTTSTTEAATTGLAATTSSTSATTVSGGSGTSGTTTSRTSSPSGSSTTSPISTVPPVTIQGDASVLVGTTVVLNGNTTVSGTLSVAGALAIFPGVALNTVAAQINGSLGVYTSSPLLPFNTTGVLTIAAGATLNVHVDYFPGTSANYNVTFQVAQFGSLNQGKSFTSIAATTTSQCFQVSVPASTLTESSLSVIANIQSLGCSSGLPMTAIIGIVVGGVFALAIIAAVVGLSLRARSEKNTRNNMRAAIARAEAELTTDGPSYSAL